ncbi:MAG TPA: alkaline phosphatase family protein [Vicinamibacterales bacterium]|nr:alkaline phosphatase family protein [Vicinamibacterales bacterium]
MRQLVLLLAAGSVILYPAPADAYIGPGAGFALLSSFLVFFTTLIVAIGAVLRWPFKVAWRLLRRGQRTQPSIRRLVVIGFDGQDPQVTNRLLEAGQLPNFARLAADGCYHTLRTTVPAISPVAWSSFATGTNPGRHNIFDFIDRDPRTYLPLLSSTSMRRATRVLRLGRWRVPLERSAIRLLRKSKPFWTTLGEHDIWSTILRVPITFPPEPFYGAQLSAMAAPDLLGTQGTFMLYSTRVDETPSSDGAIRRPLRFTGEVAETTIKGPANTFVEGEPAIEIPLRIERQPHGHEAPVTAQVTIDGARRQLKVGQLSDHITLNFRTIPGFTIRGTCRMLVTEMDQHFSLYLTPINIDPDKPAMPISHPSYYATYLAQKIGPFATLGLAEDTWALNDGVIDERTFLQQAYDIQSERERMFFASLDKLRTGSLVCVFDATDRIQHMFWRYLDTGHPAAPNESSPHHDAIEKLYRHNDEFLGRVRARLTDEDVLMVISDHGFASFRRGVNLNRWLQAEGYLTLKAGADGLGEWLRDVDWTRTRAYSLGLAGLYLNLSGRERSGTVAPGRPAADLKDEIIDKLRGLVDPETGKVAINRVFDAARVYSGPYLANAPDLVVGYNAGYRVSWEGATGVVAGLVFGDNTRAWSGDHCIDPDLVPGVLFCNRRITHENPALIDIAPTALHLFGIERPAHMEGHSLL